MTAEALLEPGTGINVTLHGTRLNGEMSYWANLKTIFKDGFVSTRLMDNHRKVIEIQDIRLVSLVKKQLCHLPPRVLKHYLSQRPFPGIALVKLQTSLFCLTANAMHMMIDEYYGWGRDTTLFL